jgi:signal peptidase I, bacterial type
MANPDKPQSKESKQTNGTAAASTDAPAGMFWQFSGPVRHAKSVCKHVIKILNHQRDILAPNAIREVESAVQNVRNAIAKKVGKVALQADLENLDKTAAKWLKPYPNASLRENFEVLLVALAVAMAVRTFFLQPFKIPTGSMQPTLYGVTSENLSDDYNIPTGLERIKHWFQGASYVHLKAPEDGEFQGVDEPVRLLIFGLYQKYYFAGKPRILWFPPDYGSELLAPPYRRAVSPYAHIRSNVQKGQFFRKGETMIKLRVNSGDHLFVDRLSYNFKAPERGDIIVFETHGIEELVAAMPEQGDTFYIKRLVGLGGETLELARDYDVIAGPRTMPDPTPVGHLVVNGRPLSAATERFENLYSFRDVPRDAQTIPYRANQYHGHAMLGYLRHGSRFTVGTNNLFVMGDNTMNSLDSRAWGDFAKERVIGRSFFVYWPISDRFGWNLNR